MFVFIDYEGHFVLENDHFLMICRIMSSSTSLCLVRLVFTG